MAGGEVETGEVQTRGVDGAPTRARRRRWTVLTIAGMVLVGCAVVALLAPVSYGVRWGFEPSQTSWTVDCGPAISSGPDGAYIQLSAGTTWTNECPGMHRSMRLTAGVLAVVGISLLLTGLTGGRHDSAAASAP